MGQVENVEYLQNGRSLEELRVHKGRRLRHTQRYCNIYSLFNFLKLFSKMLNANSLMVALNLLSLRANSVARQRLVPDCSC